MPTPDDAQLFQAVHAVAEEVGAILSDFIPHGDWPAAQGALITYLKSVHTHDAADHVGNLSNMIVIGALRGMCFDDFDSI